MSSSFQGRVHEWMLRCFGEMVAEDREERNFRFLEESLELVQANGCTREQAIELVEYVFSRPAGDPDQEVGGVMLTLAALCTASRIELQTSAEGELQRVWTIIDKIRAKHANKTIRGPLPGDWPR